MPTPASRLLELLELLQSRPVASGREIADHLGVDGRTARRYIDDLQELGIPVEGQRGVGGGYRLQPGYRLPPLMLSDDEVVMVVLGLARGPRLGLDARRDHRRECAREDPPGAAGDAPPPGRGARGDARVHELDDGGRARRCRCGAAARPTRSGAGTALQTAYTHVLRASAAERELSPYGLVVHSGRWYLAAHDHTATRCARSGSTGCGAPR